MTDDIATPLDRIASGSYTDADRVALRRAPLVGGQGNVVQIGKYNVHIGEGQDIHIGPIYHGADAEAIRAAVREALREQPVALTQAELAVAFRVSSSALRQSPNKVAGIHLERTEVGQIVAWILTGNPEERLGMLLDQPGAGKTVVMRDVLESLEQDGVPVLAIKADRLTGVRTQMELQDRLGLPATVEVCVNQAAENGPMVVMIDQLDALSMALARDQSTLDVMLSLIDRIEQLPRVRIVASCRSFDLYNDPKLSRVPIARTFRLEPLAIQVVDQVLDRLGVNPARLLPAHRTLLRMPLHLDVYARIVQRDPVQEYENFESLQALYRELWQRVVARPPVNGLSENRCQEAVYRLVDTMYARQEVAAPEGTLDGFGETARWLEGEGFICRMDNSYQFLHQTLYDYCYARRFVSQGRPLSAEVLDSPQGLFERSQIMHVLAYLRGAAPRDYRRELGALLSDPRLRTHLRLLVIGFLGSIPNPTSDEQRLGRDLLKKSDDLLIFLSAAQGNEGWFEAFRANVMPKMLVSDSDRIVQAAVQYVATVIETRRREVLSLLRPHLGKSEEWDARIAYCLSQINDWSSGEGVDMLINLFQQGRATRQAISCFHELAQTNPQAGCQAARAYLETRLQDLHSQSSQQGEVVEPGVKAPSSLSWTLAQDDKLVDEYGVQRIMEQALQRCPEALIEHLLPWMIKASTALAKPVYDTEQYAGDSVFSRGWYGEHVRDGPKFAQRLSEALQTIARTKPEIFRSLAIGLRETESLVVHRVLAQAYLADPAEYAHDVTAYLQTNRRRLKIGESMENAHYDSIRLVEAVFRHGNDEHRAALERLIMTYQPRSEMHKLGAMGHAQMMFLKAVSFESLSETARRKKQELERRWPDYVLQEPMGVRVGFVGSPIEPQAQEKMTDKQWLSAMQKYGDSGHKPPDFFKGGVEQLAASYQQQVQSNPERFYRLTQDFDEAISPHYLMATIHALAECGAPAEWVFDLARRFAPRIRGEFRRDLCRVLRKRAADEVPGDLLDLLVEWALHDADPAPDSQEFENLNPDPQRDLHLEGINSNRGIAIDTMMICALRREPPQVERTFRLLEAAAQDPSTAVRSCVVDGSQWLLSKDAKRVLVLFQKTLEGHPALLRTRPTQDFLYRCYYGNFPMIQPYIEMMLDDQDSGTRKAGGGLAALAGLSYTNALDLADRVRQGDVFMRLGAAKVYSSNSGHVQVGAACRAYLPALFNDPDEAVRRAAAQCFTHLNEDQVEAMRPLIQAFLISPALLVEAQPLVMYAVKIVGDEPELALDVAERIIDAASAQVMDIRTAWAALEREVVRLPLMVYTHWQEKHVRSRAMDIFERWLLLGSRQAQLALDEWDRR